MTYEDKLRELGYEATPEGIRRFQQSANETLRPRRPIASTGRLDAATKTAIDQVYPARHVLMLLRQGGK
jgi:hypothetical protein